MKRLLALVAAVLIPISVHADSGILYADVSVSPNPFSPNGSNTMQMAITWGIDTAQRINPLTGTQTDYIQVASEATFKLSGQEIRKLTGLIVGVGAPVAQQTVYWDGRDSVGNLAPEGTYDWTLAGQLNDLSAPVLSNVTPANGQYVQATDSVLVSGNVNDTAAVVTVNGETVSVSQTTGAWSITVAIVQGRNNIVIRAVDISGNVRVQTNEITVGTVAIQRGLADHVVVSEIMVDPTGTQASYEWVELYNPTDDTVSLSGWTIRYKSATGASYSAVSTIPSGKLIPPFGYFLVGGNLVSPAADYVDTSLGFGPTGGHIGVNNASGVMIDRVGYGNANDPESKAVGAPPSNGTCERRPGVLSSAKGNGWDADNNFGDFDTRATGEPQNSSSSREIPDSVAGTIMASVNWLSSTLDTLDISVNDIDRNNKPNAAETITVRVTSLADTVGFLLVLKEIDLDRSVFTASTQGHLLGLIFGTTDSVNARIKVLFAGDTITVAYQDPAPWQTSTVTILTAPLPRVRINEVMFNPSGTDDGKEWIELYSLDTAMAEIAGWSITDEDATSPGSFPAGATLPGGKFLVIHLGETGTNDFDYSDSVGHVYFPSTSISLANTSDQVSLYASSTTSSATIVDFMQYTTNGTVSEPSDANNAVNAGMWPSTSDAVNAAAAPEGASLRRLPDGADANVVSDWSIDSSPTKGVPNGYFVAPGTPTNLTATTMGLSASLSWQAAALGSDSIGNYFVYRRPGSGSYSDTPLAAVGSSTLAYVDNTLASGESYFYRVQARDINGVTGPVSTETSVTASNADTRIVISEIMYDPTGSEPANEWVEIYNWGTDTIDVSGWILTDGNGVYVFPNGAKIGSRRYFVLGYSLSAAGGAVDLIYGDSASGTLSLSNTGDQVAIKNSAGAVVDSVAYLAFWSGEVGQSANSNRSLERKDAGLKSNDRTTWGRSAVAGGTPRAANSVDTISSILSHAARPATLQGHDLVIHAYMSDAASPTILSHTILYWRAIGDTAYAAETMDKIQTAHSFILASDSVPAAGVEYYITTEDDANNATHLPVSNPETNPFQVTRIADDRPRVRISELMYDPGSMSEPAGEWVEIYNIGEDTADISGWIFTDSQSPAAGEGKYIIPAGTMIGAGRFFVLANTESAAGGHWNLVYGNATQGTINLLNSYANITDQVILIDTTGVVVDEANYSSQWGANNGTDPSDRTLERINYDSSANLQASWLVSGRNGGSPGEANGGNFGRISSISLTEFDPTLGATSSIGFALDKPCTVAITIEDTAGRRIRSLVSGVRYTASDTAIWNGLDDTGNIAWGVCRLRFTATDDSGTQAIDDQDNRVGLVLDEHWTSPEDYNPYFNGINTHSCLVTKPLILQTRLESFGGQVLRILFDGPIGEGNYSVGWDGRSDTGLVIAEPTLLLQTIHQYAGRYIMVRQRPVLSVSAPFYSFGAERGESVRIEIQPSVSGKLTVWVRASNDVVIRKLVTDMEVASDTVVLYWDGRSDSGDLVVVGMPTPTDFYSITTRIISDGDSSSAVRGISGRNRPSGFASFNIPAAMGVAFANSGDTIHVHQNGIERAQSNIRTVGGATLADFTMDTSPIGASVIEIQVMPRVGSGYSETRDFARNQASISAADTFVPSQGETLPITINLTATDTILAVITIYNADLGGYASIRTLSARPLLTGANMLVWDGKNDNGYLVGPGTYTMRVGHAYSVDLQQYNESLSYATKAVEVGQ